MEEEKGGIFGKRLGTDLGREISLDPTSITEKEGKRKVIPF